MITIEPVGRDNNEQAKSVTVHSEQMRYVGTVSEVLERATETDDHYVVRIGESVVGFFLIDRGYGSAYEFATVGDIGLRAFMIDVKHEGKGLCGRIVRKLIDTVCVRYSDMRRLVLTVNQKNQAAIRCYEPGGFEDTGVVYHGGAAGPQKVMATELPN